MLNQMIPLPGRKGAWLDAYLQTNCTELEMERWKTRPAMLVIPGGSYQFLAEREGEPLALRYAAAGFQTFVLHYSLKTGLQEPLLDAAAAMLLIRAHAQEWQIAPEQVAVIGSSAGGNLALWLSAFTRPGETALNAWTPCPEACHPNAQVLCYPAVTGAGCDPTFVASLPEPSLYERLAGMPPTFLWTTQDDHIVPAAETLLLGQKMNEAQVPLEMYIFQTGDHGLATADEATGRVATHVAGWLPQSVDWLYALFGRKG